MRETWETQKFENDQDVRRNKRGIYYQMIVIFQPLFLFDPRPTKFNGIQGIKTNKKINSKLYGI